MPPAELGLSAFEVGVKCVELLVFILKTADDIHKLVPECNEIRIIAKLLQDTLKKNKDSLKGFASLERLEKVLENVCIFVAECKHDSIIGRAWKVAWEKKLPGLRQEMLLWVIVLNTETTVSTRTDLLRLLDSTAQSQEQQKTYMVNILAKLSILDEMKKSLEEDDSPGLVVNFREHDSRLKLVKENESLLTGRLSIHGQDIEVICEPVNESVMRFGQQGPRHVVVYSQISAQTLVHPFYGIAEMSGKRWVVMKDLRRTRSLAAAIEHDKLPPTTLERLAIAYEVAKTMAYLHSVDILVKRLSDKNVLLVEENGVYTPCLTQLERARLFLENTSGGQYDVRYEAPEIIKMSNPQRTVSTDVYSFPFGYGNEVTSGTEAANIRKLVSNNDLPWTKCMDSNPLLYQVARIAKRCCHAKSSIRPSAGEVVHFILEAMAVSSVPTRTYVLVNEDVKERVSSQLEANDPAVLGVDDVQALRKLVEYGDSMAAFLLGTSIWKGLALPEETIVPLCPTTEGDSQKELQIKSALPHLEFALAAGIKQAAMVLAKVHYELFQLYQTQYKQTRALKTI